MIKQMPRTLFLASLLTLSLTSCGYRTAASDDKTTISVPYVEGDKQGQLTAEVIRQLTNSDVYEFVGKDGDLELKIVLNGDQHDVIGFEYDRTIKKGKVERNLMPTENRRTISAQVTLTDTNANEVVLGPLSISATGDYDYIDVNSLKTLSFINPHGKRKKVVNFSLGQLDSIEGAQDSVLTPVYRQLAQKIAAALQENFITTSDDLSKK
jgi:outer membrane lipopolysaccharide assembly protein LptE/RlpB